MLPADKERMTIILDKTEFVKNSNQLPNDTTTYRLLDTDQIAKLENEINKAQKNCMTCKGSPNRNARNSGFMASNAEQFYGLPKVYKEGIPLRSILSLPGSPTHWPAKELWTRLKPMMSASNHSATNAHQFLEKIKDITLKENKAMVSSMSS